MPSPLYTRDILRLAAHIPHLGRLNAPHGQAERTSPVCGSVIGVDVALRPDGRIEAMAQQVRACALGQASAALMGAHAAGRSLEEIEQARDALGAYLRGERDDPGAWPGLSVLAPARTYPSRHAAILLPFDAAAAALRAAADQPAAAG